MVRDRKGSWGLSHGMLSRVRWVFRAPFYALALSPRASQKQSGKLELHWAAGSLPIHPPSLQRNGSRWGWDSY